MVGTYDFGIVGAGGTGLAAAMYGARLGLKTICFGNAHGSEFPVGGVITTTNVVENYPGFIRLTGQELASKIEAHARSYPLVTIKEEKVIEIKREKASFLIKTAEGIYKTKTVLLATGTKWRKLDVPGALEFENKGVAYCALCDAPLYRNKIVAIIGGADTAAKDALVLAEHAKHVYIIYRGDDLRAEPINKQRIQQNKKIEVITKTNVLAVNGKEFVETITLDKPYKGAKELAVQGVFVAIGHEILSSLAKSLGVALNEKKEIIIDHKTSETNVLGVYAAGDVADKPFKQAITGVAEGCTAAYSAYEYSTKQKID